jgi:hypothetical protein
MEKPNTRAILTIELAGFFMMFCSLMVDECFCCW